MSDITTAAIERLFQKFSLIWGAQKVGAMVRPEDVDMALDLWASSLSRYSTATLKAVIDTLPSLGRDWPPSLAEFIDLCRQFNRPEAQVALPAPRAEATPEQLEAIRKVAGDAPMFNGDPFHWAKYPASGKAVEMMAQAAQRGDRRLQDILDKHLADPDAVATRGRHGQEATRALKSYAEAKLASADQAEYS